MGKLVYTKILVKEECSSLSEEIDRYVSTLDQNRYNVVLHYSHSICHDGTIKSYSVLIEVREKE